MARCLGSLGILIDDFVAMTRWCSITKELDCNTMTRRGLGQKRRLSSGEPVWMEEGAVRVQLERALPIAMVTAQVARLVVGNLCLPSQEPLHRALLETSASQSFEASTKNSF